MADVAHIHKALLEWYAIHARALPWRKTRDPYAILVAEIMLQQTQVDRVIPKWHAWLVQFPTLSELARATRADAVRAWEGLGYNMRAVRLHSIAVQAEAQFGGALPATVNQLMELKGVGRYTAGAVACFAFEQPVAMVDTNVRRVLSRVFSVPADSVEQVADTVMPRTEAYAWNQALMDLGATLCRPKQPLCLVCPLMVHCGGPGAPNARKARSQGEFKGSTRFYRGRILDALRRLPRGESVALGELGDRPDLVRQLASEGFVDIDGQGQARLAE